MRRAWECGPGGQRRAAVAARFAVYRFVCLRALAARCAAHGGLAAEVFRRLSRLMVDKTLPENLRLCALAGLVAANDPAVITLFKQVLASPDPFTRRLAALGLGASAEPAMVPLLIPLFADPYLDVRWRRRWRWRRSAPSRRSMRWPMA